MNAQLLLSLISLFFGVLLLDYNAAGATSVASNGLKSDKQRQQQSIQSTEPVLSQRSDDVIIQLDSKHADDNNYGRGGGGRNKGNNNGDKGSRSKISIRGGSGKDNNNAKQDDYSDDDAFDDAEDEVDVGDYEDDVDDDIGGDVGKNNYKSNNAKEVVEIITHNTPSDSSAGDWRDDDNYGKRNNRNRKNYNKKNDNYNNKKNDDDNRKYIGSSSKKVEKLVYREDDNKPPKRKQYNNNNPYGSDKLGSPSQLQIIPSESQSAQTLDQLYKVQGSTEYNQQSPYSQVLLNKQHSVLAFIKFAPDFEQWNPRNNNSQWEWYGAGVEESDNAALVVRDQQQSNGGAYYGKQQPNDDDGKYQAQSGKKRDIGHVELISVPYNHYLPPDDPNVRLTYSEGVVVAKTTYTIGNNERLLVRLKYSCKVINADKHPFPTSAVSRPWDDPRLLNCAFWVADNGDSGLLFFFSATNTGVWAAYQRINSGANDTALQFIAKRRVGYRPRYDTIIDAAIEIDNRREVVNYYLNGYRVWSIHAIGIPPPDDGQTSTSRGEGTPLLSSISSVSVAFGTMKCLDEVDPNNLTSRERLVRIQADTNFYGRNDTFVVENSRNKVLWGQGAIMKLIKMLIVRAESIARPIATVLLPGVYGPARGGNAHSSNDQYLASSSKN